MAEDEINIEDDALSLEDSDDSNFSDSQVKFIASDWICNWIIVLIFAVVT